MFSPRALPLIGDIVALARDAGSRDAFDRQLLELLDRAVGFDIAFVNVRDPSFAHPRLALRGLASERASAGLPDPAFVALLRARVRTYDAELAPVRGAALARRGVAVDSEVLPSFVMQETAYHRELRAPVGGKHSLLAFSQVSARQSLIVMLGRTGSAFRTPATALVEELLPVITMAHATFAVHEAHATAVPGAAADRARLTRREREVLDYLCLGYTNREIALACGSSSNTVRNQLAKIFAKLGATTRSEAVGLALGNARP